MDTASFAVVGRTVVIDEKHSMEKCRKSPAVHRIHFEKAAKRAPDLAVGSPFESPT
jgi:hypothetical protein